MLRSLSYSKNKSTSEIVIKAKEICASFIVAPQTAKVTTIVCEEWLAEMENGLYL